MTTSFPPEGVEVDLSDLPPGVSDELKEAIRRARLKTIELETRKLTAEAEVRHQKSVGQRYKEWALDDTIGQALQGAFVLRGS